MTSIPLTLGSLFSGIGGFELGFERTGKIKTIYQVEIDAYCRRVLAKHWPTVQRFADVRSVGKENLPYADILCGGFPCQDISNAGKRAGIDGERSGLWSEYARIICELCSVGRGPRYVVVENVAALLVRGMERVLGDLAACGYDAEWQSFPAAAFGDSHFRDRLFLLAYPAMEGRSRILSGYTPVCREESHMGTKPPAESLDSLCDLIHRLESRCGESSVCRVSDGLPEWVDRLGCVGNAIIPQIAEFIGHRIVADAFPSFAPNSGAMAGLSAVAAKRLAEAGQ